MFVTEMFFAGCEGGASSSRVVIIDRIGNLIGEAEGPSSNQWMLGLNKCAEIIVDLVKQAFIQGKMDQNTPLEVLGLSLSGIDTKQNQIDMKNAILKCSPNIAKYVHVENDTFGTKFTVTDKSSIVLISGTGSNCKLYDEEMNVFGVGGWGYKLSDEGSAYSIAITAIKIYLDTEDGLLVIKERNQNLDVLKSLVVEHFSLKSHHDLLQHLYPPGFNKTYLAKLTASLAIAANDGDKVCRKLFKNAGHDLGRLVSSVIRKKYVSHTHNEASIIIASSLKNNEHPKSIGVIACGSVFKSWKLLENGFKEGISPHFDSDPKNFTVRLDRLNITAAYGAANIAAKLECFINIPRPSNSVELLAEIESSADLVENRSCCCRPVDIFFA